MSNTYISSKFFTASAKSGAGMARGLRGFRGEKGEQGPKGDRGPPGAPGPASIGPPGKDGKDGVDGKDGESIRGAQGPPGAQGADGTMLIPKVDETELSTMSDLKEGQLAVVFVEGKPVLKWYSGTDWLNLN